MSYPQETIVAISTPPGYGGIGIVRLSGLLAYNIALEITHIKQLKSRLVNYVNFYDDNIIIDIGIILYFQAPHSFTGEDVIEFQGHGSPIILDNLVQVCVKLGARIANPGEFSERAFLNNKIDLTQAEAIADLIHSNSRTAARMAIKSFRGEFSKKINMLHDKIVYLRMYVESAIDFPEEEINFFSDGKIMSMLDDIINDMTIINKQTQQGVLLREGLSIVIIGLPNAGKSTLINCLSGRDVAIVTDIAGTTRDVIREQLLLDDLPINLIDTAGIRVSQDVIELEGMKRSWQEISHADLILLMVDINQVTDQSEYITDLNQKLPRNIPVIKVINKIDLIKNNYNNTDTIIYLSAQFGSGIDALKKIIKKTVGYQSEEGLYLARRRHLQALNDAYIFLSDGKRQLENFLAGELLAEDLRYAHNSLSKIVGEFTTDDLLSEIFSNFCIGK